MSRLGVGRATARVVLCAKGMPEFRDASDADLLKTAQVIQTAAGFQSPKSIAAWYRAHPQWGQAPRKPPTANGAVGAPGSVSAASAVADTGPGADPDVKTVRFGVSDAAIRRDTAILNAVTACRSGLLAPAVALRDSLRACVAFAAEVGQRAVCYSLIDPTDLHTLRQMQPWLRAKGETGTREFDYVQRVVMGGESCASVIASRSTALYERNALPLRALEIAESTRGPVREPELERRQRLLRDASGTRHFSSKPGQVDEGSRAERTRADQIRPDRA